ncbi:MAG: hypothetical protein RhofKO_36580 [Rhodothermales bacterium]
MFPLLKRSEYIQPPAALDVAGGFFDVESRFRLGSVVWPDDAKPEAWLLCEDRTDLYKNG